MHVCIILRGQDSPEFNFISYCFQETILEIEKMLMDAKEKLGQNSKGINSMKGSILELERKLEEVNKEIEIHREKISSLDKKVERAYLACSLIK